MSEWLLPIGVSLAAVVLTYLFCIRPMRRGHCHGTSAAAAAGHAPDRARQDLDRALEEARRDLAALSGPHTGPMAPRPLVRTRSDHQDVRTEGA